MWEIVRLNIISVNTVLYGANSSVLIIMATYLCVSLFIPVGEDVTLNVSQRRSPS